MRKSPTSTGAWSHAHSATVAAVNVDNDTDDKRRDHAHASPSARRAADAAAASSSGLGRIRTVGGSTVNASNKPTHAAAYSRAFNPTRSTPRRANTSATSKAGPAAS